MSQFATNLTDGKMLQLLRTKRQSIFLKPDNDEIRYNDISQPRIVIIGAGAAGLAAAQHLLENDFTNVIILEAMVRIGGRVWSEKIGDGYVEMGAQFLHGKNVLYDIAEQNTLIQEVVPDKRRDINPLTDHGSGGEFLFDQDIQMTPALEKIFDETYTVINEIVERCKYRLSIQIDEGKLSLGHYLRCKFDRFLLDKSNESDEIKAYRESILGWVTRVHRADTACATLDNLSGTEYAKYAGGLINIPVAAPMADILKMWADGIPSEKILLNKPVRKVLFCPENPHPVEVVCNDGQVFQADHCVVTASLGFLKMNVERFFDPPLSNRKVQAIRNAGFGTVNKIFLRFREPFWEKVFGPTDGLQLCYVDAFQDEEILASAPWYRSIHGFDVSRTLPNTLVGWVGGTAQNVEMESLKDEEIALTCQALLQKFLKAIHVPLPIEVMRANWGSNPYFGGSYSYAAKNQADHIEALSEPAWYYSTGDVLLKQVPGLLFAGEATHAMWFSTVPGALESGVREADRVIMSHKKF